jgi:hypothetical protein
MEDKVLGKSIEYIIDDNLRKTISDIALCANVTVSEVYESFIQLEALGIISIEFSGEMQ